MNTILQVDGHLIRLSDKIPERRAELDRKRAEAERKKPEDFDDAKKDAETLRELSIDPAIFKTLGWNSKLVQDYLRCCEQADKDADYIARLMQCRGVSDKLICAGFGARLIFIQSDLTVLLSELSYYLPDAETEIEKPTGTAEQLAERFRRTGERLLYEYKREVCVPEIIESLEVMIRPLGLALLRQSYIPPLRQSLYLLLKEIQESDQGKPYEMLSAIFGNAARVSASAPGAGGPAT